MIKSNHRVDTSVFFYTYHRCTLVSSAPSLSAAKTFGPEKSEGKEG